MRVLDDLNTLLPFFGLMPRGWHPLGLDSVIALSNHPTRGRWLFGLDKHELAKVDLDSRAHYSLLKSPDPGEARALDTFHFSFKEGVDPHPREFQRVRLCDDGDGRGSRSCHHGSQFCGYYGPNNYRKSEATPVWRICYMSDIGFVMNRLGVLGQEHPFQVRMS